MAYLHGTTNPLQSYTCHACHTSVRGSGPCSCGAPIDGPYVGVFDVGQGNCNAIVGADGRVYAYYDFGYSTTGHRQPTPALAPCLCDDPLIILSHLDKDHYNNAFNCRDALTMRWLMPDQAHSGIGTTLKNSIREAGGEVILWPKDRDANGRARPRSMAFPWGYVERCTGDATDDKKTNSSGLAAFVCVQDSRGKNLRVPVAGPAVQPAPPTVSQPAQRARAVVALVTAYVGAHVGHAQRAATRRLAAPLAAMLAASQTIVGRQPFMPLPECAAAATTAATRALGGATAPNILVALAGKLPTLEGKGWAAPVYAELAAAALAAAAVRSGRRRCVVAAPHFTWDASVPADAAARLARVAFAPVRSPLPPIVAGAGQFRAGQKFVLLNGDADFAFIPSLCRTRNRPQIVGLTAMHHGAIFECGETLSVDKIPYAPGSSAALAVARFPRPKTARSLVTAATEAAVALRARRTTHARRNIRPHVSDVARAAAAAIFCLEAGYPNDAAYPELAAAAAAAALAAWRHRDTQVVGLATALAYFSYSISRTIETSPVETAVDLAHAAIVGERNAASLPLARVQTLSKGVIPAKLVGHVTNLAADAITRHNAALDAQHAGDVAAFAFNFMTNSYKSGLTPTVASNFSDQIKLYASRDQILNDIATAAVACVMRPRNRHNLPARTADCVQQAWNSLATGFQGMWNLGNLGTAVTNALGQPASANPGGVAGIAIRAAAWAAERAAGYLCNASAETIRAVIVGATTPGRRREVAKAVGRRRDRRHRGGQIAYSYGVSAIDGSHEYQVDAGDLGHPHPAAIAKYEALGWTRRYNATRRARHPGAGGDPELDHPHGSVALQWDATGQRQTDKGRFVDCCRVCGGGKPWNG